MKMKVKSIKVNYFYNLFYQILSLIIPFITAPYVSRVLGPDGIGKYSYYYSIVYYFILIANLGVGSYGQIEIAKYRDDKEKISKIFYELLGLKLIIGSLCIIVFIVSSFFFSDQLLYILMSLNLIGAILDIGWFY